jgi:hypothetical protein
VRGIYEIAFAMDLGALGNIPSFIKIGSGIQKLMEGGGVYTEYGMMVA